jgi:cysteine desulfuration protein SufE
MAFAVILDETLSGAPLDEILQVSDEIVYDIFGRSISMGKGLGLRSMIRMVKAFAEQQRCRE